MYQNVIFEVAGSCNAKCPWCVTGAGNRLRSTHKNGHISTACFEKAIDRLLSSGLIGKQSIISLYNWGEPTLNPQLCAIIDILCERDLNYSISTNASKPLHLTPAQIQKLQLITFSVPGFSQNAYNRIHGFRFQFILKSITSMVSMLKAGGMSPPDIKMAFHIYQFNINEIHNAALFCSQQGITFMPSFAYINDFDRIMAYLSGTMDAKEYKTASQDLLLYYVNSLLAQQPREYTCPQWDNLVLDTECNILTCCALPGDNPDYAIGSLFNLGAEQLGKLKKLKAICTTCIKSGTAYWAHNPTTPDFVWQITKDIPGLLLAGGVREIHADGNEVPDDKKFISALSDRFEKGQIAEARELYAAQRGHFEDTEEMRAVDVLVEQILGKMGNKA